MSPGRAANIKQTNGSNKEQQTKPTGNGQTKPTANNHLKQQPTTNTREQQPTPNNTEINGKWLDESINLVMKAIRSIRKSLRAL